MMSHPIPGARGVGDRLNPAKTSIPNKSPHPVRKYVERVASKDLEEFPQWDLTKPLPKLPVPELSSTLNKYLLAVKPTVSPGQFEKTAAIVKEFGQPGGVGEYLQTQLLEYAEQKDNWAVGMWLDDMYMNVRLPLPVNSSPGMVFPRQNFQDQGEQLRFAARLISGILDYKVIIDSRALPVDRARHREKGQPLCMEQYYRLFSTYRVPGINKDVHVTSERNGIMQEPEHIIVICKNQLFILDVVMNFSRLSNDNIYTQLKRIVKMAEEGDSMSERVGILTAADRDQWGKARMKLMEDSVNRDSLDMIERCIFVLCLDDSIPLSFNHQNSVDETNMSLRDDVSLALQMLHGFGPKVNSCNRWFDKTMQFIICEDGACGLNYEHSPSEGIAVVQLIEHLLRYMEEIRQKKLPRLQTITEIPYPRKLRWRLTDDILDDINNAIVAMEKLLERVDLYVLRFTNYGSTFPKTQNSSPDAFIQLALQLTYFKVHGHLVSTYESASIRRFRLGRVDNIRACTLEALAFCKAMVGETEATDEEKMVLFRKAIKKQTDILVDTILGQGIDNHLSGLRGIAEELGMTTPSIFADETYKASNLFTLSTSQVPTTMDAFMCYGPVVPNGYGICYNPHPDNILFAITSFIDCGETHSDFFAFTLEGSLQQMHELCIKVGKSASSNGVMNGDSIKKPGAPPVPPRPVSSPKRTKLVRQGEAMTAENGSDVA